MAHHTGLVEAKKCKDALARYMILNDLADGTPAHAAHFNFKDGKPADLIVDRPEEADEDSKEVQIDIYRNPATWGDTVESTKKDWWVKGGMKKAAAFALAKKLADRKDVTEAELKKLGFSRNG